MQPCYNLHDTYAGLTRCATQMAEVRMGLKTTEIFNKFKKKTEFHDKDEWGILLISNI